MECLERKEEFNVRSIYGDVDQSSRESSQRNAVLTDFALETVGSAEV